MKIGSALDMKHGKRPTCICWSKCSKLELDAVGNGNCLVGERGHFPNILAQNGF